MGAGVKGKPAVPAGSAETRLGWEDTQKDDVNIKNLIHNSVASTEQETETSSVDHLEAA